MNSPRSIEKLHVEQSGSGTPVLLLHGLGSSGHDFDRVAPAIALRHRVIVPDMRGHGRSPRPRAGYGVPVFTADVAACCDQLGTSALHVVGLSMGGMIGFQLALDYPSLVRSLTVINSGPDMIPRNARRKLAFATRVALLRLLGPKLLARLIARKLFPAPEQQELRQAARQAIGANEPATYLAATRSLIGWSVLDRLAQVACPVLVLCSDRDYTTVDEKRAYAAGLRDARVQVIRGSGHAATIDQPAQVIDAALGFFARVESAGLSASLALKPSL